MTKVTMLSRIAIYRKVKHVVTGTLPDINVLITRSELLVASSAFDHANKK